MVKHIKFGVDIKIKTLKTITIFYYILMSNIINYNLDIVINTLSNKFGISKRKLNKLKVLDNTPLTTEEKTLQIYLDKNNNKYVLLFYDSKNTNNQEYYALQLVI